MRGLGGVGLVAQWVSAGIVGTCICAPRVLAVATIRGVRLRKCRGWCLFRLELPIVGLLLRVTTIWGNVVYEHLGTRACSID